MFDCVSYTISNITNPYIGYCVDISKHYVGNRIFNFQSVRSRAHYNQKYLRD